MPINQPKKFESCPPHFYHHHPDNFVFQCSRVFHWLLLASNCLTMLPSLPLASNCLPMLQSLPKSSNAFQLSSKSSESSKSLQSSNAFQLFSKSSKVFQLSSKSSKVFQCLPAIFQLVETPSHQRSAWKCPPPSRRQNQLNRRAESQLWWKRCQVPNNMFGDQIPQICH